MAQWNGQYTGNSHTTKVRDIEASLRHAVSVLHEAELTDTFDSKRKAVLKLAEKLKVARAKLLKAKIEAVEPVDEAKQEQADKRLTRLREQLADIDDAGIDGILKEFRASGLMGNE